MTATDIVARVRISDVAEALGVKLYHTRRRGVASWREGKNFSVSFDDTKNVWHDFVTHEGGGVVDFVARVRGTNRKEALAWLADYAGVPLNSDSATERQDFSRRMRAAKPEAEALVQWKLNTLEALREQRNCFQRTYHNAVRFLLRHDAEECHRGGDVRYELALNIGDTFWDRVVELDEQIDRLEAARYPDLLGRFRGVA